MTLPLVTVLFISFNRAQTLIPVYEAFARLTDYPRDRLELILCDDGSNADTLCQIERLTFDRRLMAARNQGLGANHNKGIRAARGDYIVSLQDDCLLIGDPGWLRCAVAAMEAHPGIAMISLLDRTDLPATATRQVDGRELRVLGNRNDAEGRLTAFGYSDQPHVKRATFHQSLGLFREGVPMTVMEREFGERAAGRPDIAIATIEGLVPFVHIGADYSFNPGNRRHRRIERIGRMPLIGPIYRTARALAKRVLGRK